MVRAASRPGSGVAARARGAGPQTRDTSPGSLPSPAGSAGPASSGAAPRRRRCPQLCRVRIRRPLTGFRDPCSLIWRRSRLRGLRRPPPPPRALPRPGHAPALARCVLPPRPPRARPRPPHGLRLRASSISGGRAGTTIRINTGSAAPRVAKGNCGRKRIRGSPDYGAWLLGDGRRNRHPKGRPAIGWMEARPTRQ